MAVTYKARVTHWGVTYQESDIIGWGDILVGGGDIIGVG